MMIVKKLCQASGLTLFRSFVVSLLVILAPAAMAGVPGTIAYQGFLASSGGTPINGPVAMTFKLYTSSAGGTALWSETQNVSVSNGTYTVLLGSVTTLNSVPFNTPYYLGVTVGTDAEMIPRQPLSSAPYALRAAIADTVISTPVVLTTIRAASNSTGVGSSTCPSNEVLVGGGCRCTGSPSTGTNFGVLFSCAPSGNSYVGACYDYFYSSLYGASPVEVRAICLTSIGFLGGAAESGKKQAADNLEALLGGLRNQREELIRAQAR